MCSKLDLHEYPSSSSSSSSVTNKLITNTLSELGTPFPLGTRNTCFTTFSSPLSDIVSYQSLSLSLSHYDGVLPSHPPTLPLSPSPGLTSQPVRTHPLPSGAMCAREAMPPPPPRRRSPCRSVLLYYNTQSCLLVCLAHL